MQLVDLSHVIEDGMLTYPGLPAPAVDAYLTFEDSVAHYAPGTEFTIGQISMVGNTGTYLDTPRHRFRDGHDLAGLPLDRCALLPTVVIDADQHAIDAAALSGHDVNGAAVLLRTGWSRHWGDPEYGNPDHPHLTEDAARLLAAAGAVLVGIDSVNIDDTVGKARPAHTVLLEARIPVVEHLTNLSALPVLGATFTAVPAMIAGLATFPVRAFATLPA